MRRSLGLAALLVCLLALGLSDAAAQRKKQVTADPATDQDYKLLQSIKDMTGKLASVNTMSVTFRLDIPHLEPNPKYRPPKGSTPQQHEHLNQLYRQQVRVMAIRNPFLRQLRM